MTNATYVLNPREKRQTLKTLRTLDRVYRKNTNFDFYALPRDGKYVVVAMMAKKLLNSENIGTLTRTTKGTTLGMTFKSHDRRHKASGKPVINLRGDEPKARAVNALYKVLLRQQRRRRRRRYR